MSAVIQLALLSGLSFCHIVLGRRVILLLRFPRGEELRWELCLALGLGLHLLGGFLLECAGVPWPLVLSLPFLQTALDKEGRVWARSAFQLKPHLNLFLWLAISLLLGASLIDIGDGIRTPWTNNYGDFAFHMGMMTSLAFGQNIPPEYQIFPGVQLSYPFLMNYWTALVWRVTPHLFSFFAPVPEFSVLPVILTYQWVLCWYLIYSALNGNRFWILPWAVLLGGGCFSTLGHNSGPEISRGAPWTLFLTTIWIPQRTTQLGAALLLTALRLFHDTLRTDAGARAARLRVLGLLLGLAPLIHTHFTIVGVSYIGLVLLLQHAWSTAPRFVLGLKAFVKDVVQLFVFLPPALLSLPWILGKVTGSGASMVKIVPGWMAPDGAVFEWESLTRVLALWGSNAGVWVASWLALWFVSRGKSAIVAVGALFIAGNVLQLAEWNWDQLKIFLGLYLVTLTLWSEMEGKWGWWLHLGFSCAFMACALFECFGLLEKGEIFPIYTKIDIERAQAIAMRTAPGSIIACEPKHNSVITLTGRRIYYGYEGTLWSHGLAFNSRKERMTSLEKLASCPAAGELRPDYLLWTDEEQRKWGTAKAPFQLHATALPYLFKLPAECSK